MLAVRNPWHILISILLIGLMSGCGPGGFSVAPPSSTDSSSTLLTNKADTVAASIVASTHASCMAIMPFYWEIGTGSNVLAGSSEGMAISRDTSVPLRESFELFYASLINNMGALTNNDVSHLRQASGYISVDPICASTDTIENCGASMSKSEDDVGKFYRSTAHLNYHAAQLNDFKPLTKDTFSDFLKINLDSSLEVTLDGPLLAWDVNSNAETIANLLQTIINDTYGFKSALGSQLICADQIKCFIQRSTSVQDLHDWSYSLGHWYEGGPLDDKSFSASGSSGTYYWIENKKQYYGIITRDSADMNAETDSITCGQNIRKAFLTGEVD